jgi:crossover junction endodeoxyribonuclease RuvC
MPNTYLGLDLSLTGTGAVFLNGKGEPTTNLFKSEPTDNPKAEDKRLFVLSESIVNLISHLEGEVKVALEGLSFMSKGRSIVQCSGYHYIVRQNLSYRDYILVPPHSLKKWAMGKGNGKKEDMKLAAFKLYGFEDKSNDVVDAFLLAHFCRQFHGDEEIMNNVQKETIEKVRKYNNG